MPKNAVLSDYKERLEVFETGDKNSKNREKKEKKAEKVKAEKVKAEKVTVQPTSAIEKDPVKKPTK